MKDLFVGIDFMSIIVFECSFPHFVLIILWVGDTLL